MNLFEVKRFHSIGWIAVFKTAGMKCIICPRMTGFKSDRAGREQMAFGGLGKRSLNFVTCMWGGGMHIKRLDK
jgi:hypothetical protein